MSQSTPEKNRAYVDRRRKKLKRMLVDEAGGACQKCGYDKYLGALQFHHRDPAEKEFTLSTNNLTFAIARLRAEAAKCDLLCANCHAELHGSSG